MKKYFFLVLVMGGALLLSACTGDKAKSPAATGGSTTTGGGQIEEKRGDTTKTGVISEANGVFYLAEAGQIPEEIDSYAVELSAYVGKTVTVTGQYSGDTLFVGSIQ